MPEIPRSISKLKSLQKNFSIFCRFLEDGWGRAEGASKITKKRKMQNIANLGGGGIARDRKATTSAIMKSKISNCLLVSDREGRMCNDSDQGLQCTAHESSAN